MVIPFRLGTAQMNIRESAKHFQQHNLGLKTSKALAETWVRSKSKSEVCRSWSRDVEALGILKSVGVPICAAKIDDHGLARGDRYPLYSDIDLGDSERKEYRRFAAHAFMNCWLNQRGEIGRASCRERVCQYV